MATTQLKVVQCPSAEPDRWVTAVEDPMNYSYGGKGACGDYAGVREIDPASGGSWAWWTGPPIIRAS